MGALGGLQAMVAGHKGAGFRLCSNGRSGRALRSDFELAGCRRAIDGGDRSALEKAATGHVDPKRRRRR